MTPTLLEMPGHLIRRLNQQSTAVFQKRLKEAGHDITPVQFSALARLEKTPGIDQATLAADIAYDRATIGGVVKRLEHKRLIRRKSNEIDRRGFNLYLTPSGASLMQNVWPLVIDLQSDIVSNLTQDEQGLLTGLMVKALNLDGS